MKKKMIHLNKAIALALVGSLVGTSAVYAADIATGTFEVAVITASENTNPALTLDTALTKALKHDYSLRNLADSNELMQKNKEDIWDSYGWSSLPTNDYKVWVSDAMYAYYAGMQAIESGMESSKYTKELLNQGKELAVKNAFASIVQDEASLALLQESNVVTKEIFEQGKVKYNLGLISKFDLDALERALEQADIKEDQMIKSIDQAYMELNNVMGEDSEKRYRLIYKVEYEPYELKGTLEQYINNHLNKDYTVLLAEQAVVDAKFTMNVVGDSSNTTSASNKNENAHSAALRTLKSTKENKELAIRNAYSQMQQLEASYVNAQATLADAEATYAKVQTNFLAGNVTQLTLDQAKLGVTKAENAITELEYSHDMQIYMFEHTSTLMGSGSAGSSSSGAEKK